MIHDIEFDVVETIFRLKTFRCRYRLKEFIIYNKCDLGCVYNFSARDFCVYNLFARDKLTRRFSSNKFKSFKFQIKLIIEIDNWM